MRTKHLPPGTRVRPKAWSIMGWRGKATMLNGGCAVMDGSSDPVFGAVDACPHEWRRMRDQTPNPEHADLVADLQKEIDALLAREDAA